MSGVPDRIVFLANRIYLVELKTQSGKLSKRQEIVFSEIRGHGFDVHVLHSKQDVEEFINEAMRNV